MSTLEGLSTEDLRKALAEREAAEIAAREEEKKQYEKERDEIVETMVAKASELNEVLSSFKKGLHAVFDDHRERLSKYGGIRSSSKGGFSLVHSGGEIRATRTRSTQPVWDERSTKAVELIGDFLRDTVKKKDVKLFEILYDFIQKNDKGELEYAKVLHLFKHKDKYTDPRWVEGLTLIQESYSVNLTGYGYEFSMKDSEGKWQKIEINFTAL